jgi:hypothetical protein
MECEKFEPLLLDELYEELDELTSAAVKRHVSGCARCASVLSGLSSTRSMVSLPLVPAPAGLEDRILAAAREAQKVVPIRSRMSRVLSAAGSWAMRPQTAMAAVFLLMVGTSAFLIRSKNYSHSSPVSVTVAGAPAPTTTAVAQSESLDDDKAAAAAHGPTPPVITRPPAAASALALAEREVAKDEGYGGEAKEKGYAAPAATAGNAATVAGAPGGFDGLQSAAGAGAAKRSGPVDQAQDPFSLGTAALRARNYAEATKQFDIAAQNGDLNSELWAAESTSQGQGCAAALGRFDRLAQKAAGQWAGNEASLRAARCEIAMGRLDPARERLTKLAQTSTHQQAAQHEMDELNRVAAAKAGGPGAGGAAAPPAAAAAPMKRAAPAAPKSPTRAPSESREQKKADDRAYGF